MDRAESLPLLAAESTCILFWPLIKFGSCLSELANRRQSPAIHEITAGKFDAVLGRNADRRQRQHAVRIQVSPGSAVAEKFIDASPKPGTFFFGMLADASTIHCGRVS